MEKEKVGFFKKIINGLNKTRSSIADSIGNVLRGFTKISEELYEELEEALILADCGVVTSAAIIERLRQKVKNDKINTAEGVKEGLEAVIYQILESNAPPQPPVATFPMVCLIVGVNGVGKTTTIGKLAHNLVNDGKSVIIAAADTFRAAAIDQLQIWADRAGATLIKQQENSDPGAVVFDACGAARARAADCLIVDTAGRLHNKQNLMNELGKISRIIEREHPTAHRETLLVLDATTGQNALQQAKIFREITGISGIVLTKIDGTAKGGIVIAIAVELGIPVRYVGVGEKIDDLQPFDPQVFAHGLFSDE